ncbi:MAG: VapC toxin family PIN domain ribonuclease [Deltaproteobacteria bacterium]|nr:MAG: VapC toxin family PIN domain ribonuclease [Deltaproteobacteria bacterium]RLC16468.1 MAG: VapC toxin family PIN domain ribonuclease [Deltaproteobacteria bacterium]
MKAIDTNILVRFLTGDDDLQANKVYSIFKKAESEKIELFVPLLVVLEMIWVLESVYEISRAEILDAIGDLLLMPIFKFDQQPTIPQLIQSAKGNKYDLSDLLIAHSAKINGCEAVLTFDKKASKFNLFELVKSS